jgi:DNA-3-methyladenine glycosylase
VLREGESIPSSRIVTTTRIGITKAAEWPLRYYVAGNEYVSRS